MTETISHSIRAFDVGAHAGEWSALALRINSNVTVHCLEPSKATFQQLLSKRLPENVVCNNMVLGSFTGDAELHVFHPASGMNSLYIREGLQDGWHQASQQPCETVKLVTLDEYCEKSRIDFIDYFKIDVDGYELEVLRGASHMLGAGRVGFIQSKYGGCNIDAHVLIKDLFELFSLLPYTVHKVFSDKLQEAKSYGQRLENFQYQNWVAILRETP